MNLIGSRGNRRHGIRHGQAAVVVPVPIHADFFTRGLDDFLDREFHQVVGAARSCVANRVAQDDGASAGANGGRIERDERLRVGANGVLGDIHHRESGRHRLLHRVFGGALKEFDGPVLYQPPDRAGAEKERSFQRLTDALAEVDDRLDVLFLRAPGCVGPDFQAGAEDFARQRLGIFKRARPRAGQADVDRVDSQRIHQLDDFDFFGDGRVAHGRILQPVAKGFVVEQDAGSGRECPARCSDSSRG